MSNSLPPSGIYPFYDELGASKEGVTASLYRLVRPVARFLPIPRHTFFPLLYELYLAGLRLVSWPVPWRYRGRRDLLVNLGAGANGRPGWVNVDIFKAPGVNCRYDCRKRLPFSDGAVRGIYCEHFFEHLDYTEEVPAFLSDCHRVLRPGGVLRIAVPDAGRYLEAYNRPGWEDLVRLRPLEPGHVDAHFRFAYRTKMELVNMVFRQGHHHKYAYDYETVDFVLRRYGFSQVSRQPYRRSLLPELAIDDPGRASESLYVDASK